MKWIESKDIEWQDLMGLQSAFISALDAGLQEQFPLEETIQRIREGRALEDFLEKARGLPNLPGVCSPERRAVRDEIEGRWRFILFFTGECPPAEQNGLTLMVSFTHELLRAGFYEGRKSEARRARHNGLTLMDAFTNQLLQIGFVREEKPERVTWKSTMTYGTYGPETAEEQ